MIGYVAYVFLTYSRIKDNVSLEINGTADTTVQTGQEYTIVTYNIGFGAYTPDFTRSFHVNQAELLEEKFNACDTFDSVFASNYHSAYLMYPATKPHGASNSGLLTESRFDITSSLRRSFPIAKGFKKILDLDRCYSIFKLKAD